MSMILHNTIYLNTQKMLQYLVWVYSEYQSKQKPSEISWINSIVKIGTKGVDIHSLTDTKPEIEELS